MSYLTQRLANKFPLWSNLRMDPSSFGHRFLQSYGEALEENEITTLRLAQYNEALYGGGPIFDIWSLQYVDIGDIGLTFAPFGPEGDLTFPLISYINEDGEKTYIPKAASWDDFYYSVPDKLVLAEPSFKMHKIGYGFDERSFEIWNSNAEKAEDLGPNDDGVFPTGDNDALRFQVAFGIVWPFSKAYRLGVSVTGSTNYLRFGDVEDSDNPYLGHHKIYIRGIDHNGEEVQEEIQVYDDGYFTTKNLFTKVCSIGEGLGELPAVDFDGFNGDVAISVTDARQRTKVCPFLRAVSADSSNTFDDFGGSGAGQPVGGLNPTASSADYITGQGGLDTGLEGPLVMELSVEDGAEGTFLDSYFNLYSNGQMYRRENLEIDEEEDLRELICSQFLLDAFSEPVIAVDFTFNWHDGKCYVLDESGRVHAYKLSPTAFEAQTFPRTKLIDIEAKPLTRRAVYGESIPVWTWHRILRKAVKHVTIMRESPAAVSATIEAVEDGLPGEPIFRGEYLQADLTWGPDKYHFLGNSTDGGPAELSWNEKKFWTEFPVQDVENIFDTLGQWNFYIETALQSDKQIQLEAIEQAHNSGSISTEDYWQLKEQLLKQEEEVIIHRSSTSIMCEYLVAEKTYGSVEEPLIDLIPAGIYIDEMDNKICLVGREIEGFGPGLVPFTINHVFKFDPICHKWFPEVDEDLAILREDYTALGGVTVEMDGLEIEVAEPEEGFLPQWLTLDI